MALTSKQLADLVKVRHQLHRAPDRSGHEAGTAAVIVEQLEQYQPDEVLTGLGGHGVAALFRTSESSAAPIVIRCELDALPIEERGCPSEYASTCPGVSHKCGHDGHMVMCLGVAALLRACAEPVSLALLFQPAEEIGAGAAAVLRDGRLDAWAPRAVIALHNLPGYALGSVITRTGTFGRASCGMDVRLTGVTTHAATPDIGRSTAPALAHLIDALHALGRDRTGSLVTITHAAAGQAGVGFIPADARLMAALRAETDADLQSLRSRAEELVRRSAEADGLEVAVSWREAFPALRNTDAAVASIRRAAGLLDRQVIELDQSLPFSEDFAHLCARYGGAMFGLGAGETCPSLHDATYDFPDALIEIGACMLFQSACNL